MPTGDLAPLQKSLMRNDVYEHLKKLIVQGTLEPDEKLRDIDLANKLGVSRTPVREALRRLEDEGLVETKHNAWTRVSAVPYDLAERIYPIISTLEPLALEMAFESLTPEDFRQLRELNSALEQALISNDAKKAALLDSAFHDVFILASNNPELIGILNGLKTNHIRLEIKYWQAATSALQSVQEHARLIAALGQGNLEQAKRELAWNWIRALDRWNKRSQVETQEKEKS
jgi:DNA-binding GntR family transcriptional regulator